MSALHALNDTYTAFLPPLLPRLMGRLDLSIAGAATLTAALALGSSLAQPLLGHVADRGLRRALVLGGPVVTGVFLCSIGFAPGFPALVVLLAVGGLGSAAFHPSGAALAVRADGGPGSGVRHAVFSFGGALGYALGPLIAVALVARVGLEGLWVAMIPVVLLALALAPVLRATPRPLREERAGGFREAVGLLGGPLGLVFGISASSAFVQRLYLTMEPIAIAAAGGSERTGAIVLTAYLGGQAAGTLLGGVLADRLDRGRLLAVLAAVAVPLHALALLDVSTGPAALGVAFLAGTVNQAVLPPVVVMALELVPRRAALVSGIVMGLAWATGSSAVLFAGFLGDAVGARMAGAVLTPVGLIGVALALRPSLSAYRRPAAA